MTAPSTLRHRIILLFCAWLLGLALPARALDLGGGAVVRTEQVRAQLLVHAPAGVAPGQPLWVGLKLEHAPGWHSYWKNPGDSGLPTELRWTLPDGVSTGEIAWPTPRKFPLGELANYGYEGGVLLPVPLTVTRFGAERLKVGLDASWLVCRVECLPQQGRFELVIPAGSSTVPDGAEFEAARAAAPQTIAAGDSRLQPDDSSLQVELDGLPAAWRGQRLEIFPETTALIAPGARWTQAWDGARWTARLPLAADRSESPPRVALVVALAQAGGAPAGVRIEAPVTGAWPATGPRSELPDALKLALEREAARAAAADPAPGAGFWAALLGALAGGLILNLMPCVFPVLAIKVMAFARHAEDRRAHRQSGLAYTAGALLSFVALGALLLALRAAGEQLGWGFQLQDPAVVAALAVLFTVVGLNLAGLFEFGRMVPSSLAGLQLRHPVADAFLTGMLAVAVASPCTAPFMGASLGLAVALPPLQALAVFAAIGFGMALPYLAASWLPGIARALPRPGAWMQTLREFMAFPMLATVVWLLWVLGQQTGIEGAATLLLALLLLAWLGWALARRGVARALVAPAALAALVALVWQQGALVWTPAPQTPATSAALPAADRHWHAWTPQRMAQLQQAGTPFFVDYTAAWCVTCQYNKTTTLADAQLLDRFAAAGVVLLRADWTRRDPEVTRALAAVGRNGVPTYALHGASGKPLLLPELLTVAGVSAALDALAAR